MRFAHWQPGDEAAITGLFQTVFNQPMTADYWHWRYRGHPAGDPLVMLAWDGDRLAGHYGASHAPIRVDGEQVPAALAVSTMTHPDYRGQGLLEKCANGLYEVLTSRGIQAVWGFPNRNINVLRQVKLQWEPIADIAMLSRPLIGDEVFSPAGTEIVDRIDARFDALNGDASGIHPDRSHEILSWRIDRNPSNRYRRIVLPSDGGSAIAGYAILKPYGDAEFDLVALRALDRASHAVLIRAALAEAASCGARKINCWSLPRDPARQPLERAGFVAGGPVTYFGGRSLAGQIPGFNDSRRWHLSMLDSDLY